MNDKLKRNSFLCNVKQSITVTLILLVLCGFLFPVVLTGLSSLIFPKQAKGNLVMADNKVVGSTYVGQDFTKDYFMKGRPSAYNYNTYYEDENGDKFYNTGDEFAGLSSGSNNYAASNPALVERVENDIQNVLSNNPGLKREDIPADLVTASGSGLDPHISVKSAMVQLPAISKASKISEEDLKEIVKQNTTPKTLGVFGEEVVNVLGVNMDIAHEMGIISKVVK